MYGIGDEAHPLPLWFDHFFLYCWVGSVVREDGRDFYMKGIVRVGFDARGAARAVLGRDLK